MSFIVLYVARLLSSHLISTKIKLTVAMSVFSQISAVSMLTWLTEMIQKYENKSQVNKWFMINYPVTCCQHLHWQLKVKCVGETFAWNPLQQRRVTLNKFQRTCFVWLKHKKIIDCSGAKNAFKAACVFSFLPLFHPVPMQSLWNPFSNQDDFLWMYHTASPKCLEQFNAVIFCFHKWGGTAAWRASIPY